MIKHSHVPPICPDCGASLPHTHPTAIERCEAIKRQRKIETEKARQGDESQKKEGEKK